VANTLSARAGTALAHRRTPPARIGEVLSALAEGLTIGAAVRVIGHREATITRWRDRAAEQAERLHRHFLHDMHLPHVQLAEVRVRLRRRSQLTWLWLALDPATKRIPALALGPRTQQTASGLVHALCAPLAPGCTPVVTTDGLRHYFYALTAHFGRWVAAGRRQRWQVSAALLYGQVQKRYRQRRLVRIKYRLCCGSPRAVLPPNAGGNSQTLVYAAS
jgi:IS1 family transposase